MSGHPNARFPLFSGVSSPPEMLTTLLSAFSNDRLSITSDIVQTAAFEAGPTLSHLAFVIHMHYIIQANDGDSRMPSNALVQTRIDAEVKERATAVLEAMGLTVSDAVRILLTRTAREGALPLELISNSSVYDAWFRAKVQQALDDTRPDTDDADAEANFTNRRSAALRKAATSQ